MSNSLTYTCFVGRQEEDPYGERSVDPGVVQERPLCQVEGEEQIGPRHPGGGRWDRGPCYKIWKYPGSEC